ncbi:MAG: hypothetical protein RLY31_1248 [Bacteroidota bacterium]|jgi:hypothetical protein
MDRLPAYVRDCLSEPYGLTAEQTSFYERNRFIRLEAVLPDEVVGYYRDVIDERVRLMNREDRPLEARDTYGKAFLQLFNLWREDERIRALVLSPRLGRIAAGLMGTAGVRLYHDQALYKEAGGGITPWHADQYYWPLSTDRTVTAWIPLQATPLEMGPLEFSAGSHVLAEGRELAIGDESERMIGDRLRVTDFRHVVEPYAAGDLSFHSGWVFHRAGANATGEMRRVMTAIYMDREMRLKAPENKNQEHDWHTWCPGAPVGAVIDTPLNPVAG